MRRINKSLFLNSLFSKSYFDDSDDDAAKAAAAEEATRKAAAGNQGKTFTQADVDRVAAEERRKWEAKNKTLITQMENLQKSSKLTQQEKDDLATQIEEIKNQSLTKEQVLLRDYEGLKKKYDEETTGLTQGIQTWQQRHNNMLISHTIGQAAANHGAFRPEQLQVLLQGNAKLVEEKDEEGNPKGTFQALFKFTDIDAKTKKPIQVEMDADSVMKRMKELPEIYGNLFKSTLQGGTGLGGSGGKSKSGEPDIKGMTPEEYREHRKTRGY